MLVNNKNIIVTGGGNGVGRELVIELIKKGANVIAIDINEKALEETKHLVNHSNHFFSYKVDISNIESIKQFTETAIEMHSHIDGIINNAGIIQPFISLNDLDSNTVERVMAINFYGTYYLIKALLPHLLTRPEAHILNVSSMGGFLPVPGQSVYGASKAAVKLLSESLNSELKDTCVNVSVVIPGGIATDIKKNSGLKNTNENKSSKLILTPNKAALGMIHAIEKNKKVVYLGKDSKIMHFLTVLNPSLASHLISSVMKSNEH